MTDTYVVRDLIRRLPEDEWRRSNEFSADIKSVHDVLFHPYADDARRQEALKGWFQKFQPCVFGRIAATVNALHYVFLDDDDLRRSDQHITQRIQHGRRAWRQRGLSPREGFSAPAHGLVLSIVSPRVSLAEPSDVLRQLALELLRLWGCRHTSEPQGEVHWEDLYLENPTDETFVRFSFSIDFFASAGDGRWWHDHRVPGGLAFTANSAGHMGRYREWYQGKTDQRPWLLETAMATIAEAAETESGKATWLRPLTNGFPFVRHVSCPVPALRPKLAGYDWTRYAGHLHTDHAVRSEFFRREATRPATTNEWVQDFQYLYDAETRDHIRFVKGVAVSKQEVHEEVGRPEDYVEIASPRREKAARASGAGIVSTRRERRRDSLRKLDALVEVCRSWALTPDELRELDGY